MDSFFCYVVLWFCCRWTLFLIPFYFCSDLLQISYLSVVVYCKCAFFFLFVWSALFQMLCSISIIFSPWCTLLLILLCFWYIIFLMLSLWMCWVPYYTICIDCLTVTFETMFDVQIHPEVMLCRNIAHSDVCTQPTPKPIHRTMWLVYPPVLT